LPIAVAWTAILAACVPAYAADPLPFWQGAITAVDRVALSIDTTASGRVDFAGPNAVTCQALRVAQPGQCSMPVIHLQEGRVGTSSSLDKFLHLYMGWLPTGLVPAAYAVDGLPDMSQYCLYRSVQCVSRALDVSRLQGATTSRGVGIVAEGLGAFAAITVAALRPDDISFILLHQPTLAFPAGGNTNGSGSWLKGVLTASTGLRPRADLVDFDYLSVAPKVRCPVLMLYTKNDPQCPLLALNELYAAFKCPKDATCLNLSGHIPFSSVPNGQAIFADFTQQVLTNRFASHLWSIR